MKILAYTFKDADGNVIEIDMTQRQAYEVSMEILRLWKKSLEEDKEIVDSIKGTEL